MKVLIAGGAGYIGSHAVRQMQKAGHEIVVIDNLSNGHAAAIDCELVEGDIGDSKLVELVLREFEIDAVMHFAAFIEVGESVTDPGKYYRNNFSNTLSLLSSMTACGVRKIVF